MVGVSVGDTGPGIAPEHLERIFDRFFRVDQSRSRALGGTGLGLAIARLLAELQGGEIRVESAPGAGSTFTVWLPAAGLPPPPPPPPIGGGGKRGGACAPPGQRQGPAWFPPP